MKSAKENNLRGLTEQEVMMLNGGKIDWSVVGSGLYEAGAGIVEGVGGIVSIPTTKGASVVNIVDGGNRFVNGMSSIFNELFQ